MSQGDGTALAGKLFFYAVAESSETLDRLRRRLGLEFTPVDLVSASYAAGGNGNPSNSSGGQIRQWFSTSQPVFLYELGSIQQFAERLEATFTHHGFGRLSLVPGYVTAMKAVRICTEDAPHRIALSAGCYAEPLLVWEDDGSPGFRGWPWSPKEYALPEVLQFFGVLRDSLLESTPALAKQEI